MKLWRGFDLVDEKIVKAGSLMAPDSGGDKLFLIYQHFQEKWVVVLIQ